MHVAGPIGHDNKGAVHFGTRPEAIKLCPVIRHMKSLPNDFDFRVCVNEISAAMRRFFEDPQLRASYAAKGIIQAEQYTSRNVAATLLAVYRNIVYEK